MFFFFTSVVLQVRFFPSCTGYLIKSSSTLVHDYGRLTYKDGTFLPRFDIWNTARRLKEEKQTRRSTLAVFFLAPLLPDNKTPRGGSRSPREERRFKFTECKSWSPNQYQQKEKGSIQTKRNNSMNPRCAPLLSRHRRIQNEKICTLMSRSKTLSLGYCKCWWDTPAAAAAAELRGTEERQSMAVALQLLHIRPGLYSYFILGQSSGFYWRK